MRWNSPADAQERLKRLILAAEGFIQLGMVEAAWDELEEIAPEFRHVAEVMLLRVFILNTLKKWEAATIIGQEALERYPDCGDLYIATAYATRRFLSIQPAKAILLRGEPVLKNEAVLHYNLACYECQLGNIAGAKVRLRRAFDIRIALDDPDLEPLWGSL